jgi:hypothetical protein
MRTVIHGLIINDPGITALIPADRWFQASSIDAAPQLPFGVIRISGNFPTPVASGQRRIEVWVHDAKGSYIQIDDILELVQELFDRTFDVVDDGWRLTCMTWDNDSPDLFDDGYGTNCKMKAFTATGRKLNA